MKSMDRILPFTFFSDWRELICWKKRKISSSNTSILKEIRLFIGRYWKKYAF